MIFDKWNIRFSKETVRVTIKTAMAITIVALGLYGIRAGSYALYNREVEKNGVAAANNAALIAVLLLAGSFAFVVPAAIIIGIPVFVLAFLCSLFLYVACNLWFGKKWDIFFNGTW